MATARQQAHDETFRRLVPLLSLTSTNLLDGLLQPDRPQDGPCCSWLRQEAVSHAASHIIATLTKIVFLQDAGVDQWDLCEPQSEPGQMVGADWLEVHQSVFAADGA